MGQAAATRKPPERWRESSPPTAAVRWPSTATRAPGSGAAHGRADRRTSGFLDSKTAAAAVIGERKSETHQGL